jgi:catechol 2,3-dioxygenase-like lactoylglutathione lyase family enzyme
MAKAKSKARPAKKAAKPTKAAGGTKKMAARSGSASTANKKPAAKTGAPRLEFNHAMIYAREVARSIDFYRGRLGFKLIEDFRHEGQPVYARLQAPAGEGTIAIHQAPPGAPPPQNEGVRLYFEIETLDEFCQKLQRAGIYFTQPPRMMPWGWRHAYLDDPDGHEISLYWAGANRMMKTVMQAAKEAKKVPKAARPR